MLLAPVAEARLTQENGLVAYQKRRIKRTTDSQHPWLAALNLLTSCLRPRLRTKHLALVHA